MALPAVGDPTLAETAEELRTSIKFVRARIVAGDLAAYRLKGSRLIRIRRESLEALKVPVYVGGVA